MVINRIFVYCVLLLSLIYYLSNHTLSTPTPTATAALPLPDYTMICWPSVAGISLHSIISTSSQRGFSSFFMKKLTTSCLCCTDVVQCIGHRQLEIHPRRLHSTLHKKQMQRRGSCIECDSLLQRPSVGTTLRPNLVAAHDF